MLERDIFTWSTNRVVMGLNLGLVKRAELNKTHLVGYGPLLVCSGVPLLGTVKKDKTH